MKCLRILGPLLALIGTGCGASPPVQDARSDRSQVNAVADEPPTAVPDELRAEPAVGSNSNSDWVVVSGFDVAFRLPSGWHRMGAEEVIANREEMLAGSSAELARRAESAGWARSLQVAAMERDPATATGLIPTIQVQLRVLPQEIPSETLCELTFAQIRSAMTAAELVANEPVLLGSIAGHRCTVDYTIDTTDGQRPVEADVYFVMRGTLNLQLSFSGPSGAESGHIQRVLASFRSL